MKNIKITLIGDSMTQSLENFTELTKILNKKLNDTKIDIINHGVGGTRIGYGIYRVTHNYIYNGINKNCISFDNPDIILLESFAYNNRSDDKYGLESYKKNVIDMISTLQDTMNSKIIMYSTISPDYDNFLKNVPNFINTSKDVLKHMAKQVDWYMEIFKKIADEKHIPFVDIFNISKKIKKNESIASRYFINQNDGIHPSKFGMEFIAKYLSKEIEKYI